MPTLGHIAKNISKAIVPVYTPISHIGELHFLHILTNAWYVCLLLF